LIEDLKIKQASYRQVHSRITVASDSSAFEAFLQAEMCGYRLPVQDCNNFELQLIPGRFVISKIGIDKERVQCAFTELRED
jgi:hypothetical protein